MSVRAYRVKGIDYEKDESFNLYHDEVLVDFLQRGGWFDQLNVDGCGLIDIPIEVLTEALALPGLDSDTVKTLKCDIKSADEYSIQYYCF